jgi:hypothetical protein
MEEIRRAPLPWEHQAAIGGLGLLTLQKLHEGILSCLGKPPPGFHVTSALFLTLLVVCVSVGVGLAMRRRSAWWAGVIVMGLAAYIHAKVTWRPVWMSLRFDGRVSSAHSIFEMRLNLDPFEILWLSIRSALLIAVPALLLLGRLRQELNSR